MTKNNRNNNNKKNNNKKRTGIALLLVVILAAALFLMSDIGFIKSARDSLMGRLGYVSEEKAAGESLSDQRLPEDGDDGGASEDSGSQPNSQSSGAADKGSGIIGNSDYIDPDNLPEFDGNNYVEINGNKPVFPDEVYKSAGLVLSGDKWKTDGNLFGTVDSNKLNPFEYYSVDDLGRCEPAYGCLGRETMPAEGQERGDISSVHPTGWAKGQRWERCHLIAWSLSAENANEGNLVTGTHYLNYDGMRPFEEETSHYIWSTGNHVLYMSEPVFKGNELVPRGVHMVAQSVEDNGKGLSFNIYCFNVTPGAEIDYNTGIVTTAEQATQDARLYVVNKRSGVFHYPSCDGAKSMSKWNREEVTATRSELTAQGYTPCGACEP